MNHTATRVLKDCDTGNMQIPKKNDPKSTGRLGITVKVDVACAKNHQGYRTR